MDTHPESGKLGLCSWRALPVPPMLHLVHSLHASIPYSTRVLPARTTRTADDAACAILERLMPLLDLDSFPGKTALPMLQLVQSSNASGLYSTQVPWQAQTALLMLQLVQSTNASGPDSTRVHCPVRTAPPILQLV